MFASLATLARSQLQHLLCNFPCWLHLIILLLCMLHATVCNWTGEASPTLGCSIEISRDIYVCLRLSMGKQYKKIVCQKMRGRNYVVQTRACSKISFGSLKRSADYKFRLILNSTFIRLVKPTSDTRKFISTLRKSNSSMDKKNVHLEMRKLMQTELQRLNNRGKKG